jgi:hypothetical protein
LPGVFALENPIFGGVDLLAELLDRARLHVGEPLDELLQYRDWCLLLGGAREVAAQHVHRHERMGALRDNELVAHVKSANPCAP